MIEPIRRFRDGMSDLVRKRWRRADFRAVFTTPEGRRVLADIYREGGIMAQTHVPGDPVDTAFREGKRRLALYIAGVMKDDPDAAHQLQDEGRTDGY